MLRYGLTGGIASGKSTVAAMLRELGFPVIEADQVAHQVMEPGQPAYNEVVAIFGDAILDSDNASIAAVLQRSSSMTTKSWRS